MLELGLQERTNVISSPAQLVSWRLDAPEERSLLLYPSIVDAYDEASNGLLILGAPGAGKSTLLRELACELVGRAEQDPDHAIPVLANLSSWATKKLPLKIWLVEQLQVVYTLPRHLIQSWIEQDQFLLLLDGLDEVEASARPTCIDYINAYRGAHFVPLVVCSRSHEYLTQAQRLTLPYAVEVQPLAPEQVESYLKRVGKPVAAVRAVLRSNPVLHDLVTTPLMLSVIVLAYRGKMAKDLPQLGTLEEKQRQVFAYYMERMLEQRTRNWHYSSQQTRRWLIWLARQMQQRQLTEFYLESLQHFWLPTKRAQELYPWLVVLIFVLILRLVVVPLGMAPGWTLGGLFGVAFFLLLVRVLIATLRGDIQSTLILRQSWSNFRLGVVVGLLYGLLYGLVAGLLIVLSVVLSKTQLDEDIRIKPNQGIYHSGWNALSVGLVVGLLMGLLFALRGGLLFALLFGGTAFLNHYLIRFFLWRSGVVPWHYVRFLDEAAERILLQPVGGGYRFIHPLFQEYYASLGTASPLNSVTPPTSHHP